MTFLIGQSGNPNGRPKGALSRRVQLTKLLEPHAEQLINNIKPDNKSDYILSIFFLKPEEVFSPVQVQKLFFLLDKRLDLNFFDFKPYHYGPYSHELTNLLDTMSAFDESIEKKDINGITHYQLSASYLSNTQSWMSEKQRKFILSMIGFVKKLSFKQLCMAIYKEFPEMAENSVFFKVKNK